MSEPEMVEGIVGVLAEIRAMPFPELVAEVDALGMAGVMVSSHEMVAILVMLEPVTGVDPTDREVLKGCSLQSLEQVVAFVMSGGRGNP
jgi:hypothetical protein